MVRINEYEMLLGENKIPYLVKTGSELMVWDERIGCPEDINLIAKTALRLGAKAEEFAYMIALDSTCKIIGLFQVSHGTVDLTVLRPREVYIRALLCGATQVAVVHNHPSGDTEPSQADSQCCTRMEEAGQLLGVKLMDFVITGSENYYSFAEHDLLKGD